MSIVRDNLMEDPKYSPYCPTCVRLVRTTFKKDQFSCYCGWESQFPDDFIKAYKEKHGL